MEIRNFEDSWTGGSGNWDMNIKRPERPNSRSNRALEKLDREPRGSFKIINLEAKKIFLLYQSLEK